MKSVDDGVANILKSEIDRAVLFVESKINRHSKCLRAEAIVFAKDGVIFNG